MESQKTSTPRGVLATRWLLVASWLAYTWYFDRLFGLTFDQKGMDGMWPVTWVLSICGLVLAHLPAWLLMRRLASGGASAVRDYILSVALPLAIVIAGVGIQGADWEELALFLIPTVPGIVAITWLAMAAPSADSGVPAA